MRHSKVWRGLRFWRRAKCTACWDCAVPKPHVVLDQHVICAAYDYRYGFKMSESECLQVNVPCLSVALPLQPTQPVAFLHMGEWQQCEYHEGFARQ